MSDSCGSRSFRTCKAVSAYSLLFLVNIIGEQVLPRRPRVFLTVCAGEPSGFELNTFGRSAKAAAAPSKSYAPGIVTVMIGIRSLSAVQISKIALGSLGTACGVSSHARLVGFER